MRSHKTARRQTDSYAALLAGLSLVVATFVVYYPVVNNRFFNLDDDEYVARNRRVQAGLTWENICWTFTSATAANWHPLTMLSLLIDCEFSAKDPQTGRPVPSLFHLTNLLLHTASAFVLFWVLKRMTGCLWRSAWVAALFALHPLHVESVAWVAERKDVLSGLFWMLSLLAYVRYVEAPGWQRSFIVTLMMALGLLAKSMLVSLPFVFLLIDYWPLGRLFKEEGGRRKEPSVVRGTRPVAGSGPGTTDFGFLFEKIPFFALTGLFCVITMWTQWHWRALRSFGDIPLTLRLQNIPVAYVVYLRKMIWPFDLAPFYPFPGSGVAAWETALALLFLTAVTVLVWTERRRRPYLIGGWLWYVVTLTPVIGLVQVGDQAYADRYSYIPLVGIFVMVAWGVADLWTAWTTRRVGIAVLAACVIAACAILTRVQVGRWSDSVRLWRHTLEVAPDNYLAHHSLGVALNLEGKKAEAMEHFLAAVTFNPKYAPARTHLARSLVEQGQRAAAAENLRIALEHDPGYEPAHALLGRLCLLDDQIDEAVNHFREALRIAPDDADVHFDLGEALSAQGNYEEAVREMDSGTRLAPRFAQGHYQLGLALGRMKRWPEAAAVLGRALELDPSQLSVRCDLALALQEMGETQKAADLYAQATQMQPDWTTQFNTFAWSCLDSKGLRLHKSNRALELAMEVCQATGYRNPAFLETLATAYAATGHIAKGQETAQKAVELATASKQDALARQIKERWKSYQSSSSIPNQVDPRK
jgi:Tfp pilus assembly protein PilF